MDESKQIILNNVWGDPYEYKKIKIYPIKLKNALEFYQYITCLTIDKNTIPDPQIIKMSYLEFIITLSQQGDDYKILYDNLINLLSLILQKQPFIIDINKNNKFIIRILSNTKDIELYQNLHREFESLINNFQEDSTEKEYDIKKIYGIKNQLDYLMLNNAIVLDGKDFDKMRKIILKQNLVKFDDELVNAEVKKALQEAQEFINKKNGDKQATLEELIFSYVCDICNGKPQDYQDTKELTIYQFHKGLQRKSLSKQQMMLSTALGMGAIPFKDIPDWLNHIPENGLYDDAILKDEEKSKLEKLNEKSIIK